MPNSILVDRRPIALAGHLPNIVAKMYGPEVVEETIVEKITYLSDGLKVKGYLARPAKSGKYPVLIWNRGGSGDRGALTDLTAFLILASTAVWGYVVLATHYRGNKGSEGEEDWGGNDVHDSLNLLQVASLLPEADPGKVAIEGASRGGMTTYRALTMENSFRCAIVHAGITDLAALAEEKKDFVRFLNKIFGHLPEKRRQEEYRRRSAVFFADKLPKNVPILIMHGTADESVPPAQSTALVEQLKKHGVPHKFELIKGGGHVALKDGSYRRIDELRKAWLARHLR
jgi:dipeptidyl aminopeptidase/acylaminoacyl peptidase